MVLGGGGVVNIVDAVYIHPTALSPVSLYSIAV